MKNDLTTGAWQHDIGCPISILLFSTSNEVRAVKWYHHYLHHPGHTRLEETMNTAMYWKGMRTTIRSLTKSCRQVNKRRSQKYGHLPPKTVHTIPWEFYVLTSLVHTLLKAEITRR
jgi:hypothetical protein